MDLSRREFVKTAVAGSLAAGTAGLLSGCGISAAPAASSAAVASGPPRRGGTLRAAITGGSTADTLDPLDAITNADFSRVDNLYEPLVGLTPDAQAVLVLADEVTPNAAATEWTVRLKSGITFHNGKDLTADDVIYTFQTIMNPKAPAAAAAGCRRSTPRASLNWTRSRCGFRARRRSPRCTRRWPFPATPT